MRERLPLPKKIQNAPQLMLGLELYLGAFYDLSTSRPQAFGLAPIPWGVISDYCDRLGLEPEQRDDMHHHIRALDDAYLKWARQKEQSGGKSR